MSVGNWLRASSSTVRHLAALWRSPAEIMFLNPGWAHHGRHSGYLVDAGIGPTVYRADRLFPYPLEQWWGKRHDDPFWELRLVTRLNLAASGAKLLHVMDGDFDPWLSRMRPLGMRARLTATFHQPVDVLGRIVGEIAPGALDAIICVSRDQIPLLAPLVPEGRCVFIPHGVDTAFFCPNEEASAAGPPVVLSVGVHRRDFRTLLAAAREIKARRPDVVIRLIGPADKVNAVRDEAAGLIEARSGVSDAELRDQYRAATVVLLPLEQATANNALLEAVASARPVVITDLPALRDYVTEDSVAFCPPGDAAAHATATLALLDDPARRASVGRAGRQQAEALAWPAVRKRVQTFLSSVIAG